MFVRCGSWNFEEKFKNEKFVRKWPSVWMCHVSWIWPPYFHLILNLNLPDRLLKAFSCASSVTIFSKPSLFLCLFHPHSSNLSFPCLHCADFVFFLFFINFMSQNALCRKAISFLSFFRGFTSSYQNIPNLEYLWVGAERNDIFHIMWGDTWLAGRRLPANRRPGMISSIFS